MRDRQTTYYNHKGTTEKHVKEWAEQLHSELLISNPNNWSCILQEYMNNVGENGKRVTLYQFVKGNNVEYKVSASEARGDIDSQYFCEYENAVVYFNKCLKELISE